MPVKTPEESIRTLMDFREIETLKARYCRLVDEEDWAEFRRLFVDDATFDLGAMGLLDSADLFLAKVIDNHSRSQVRSVHRCFMPEIELLTPDSARAIWAMADYVDRVGPSGRSATRGYGHYHEEYRRTNEGWKISSLRLTRIRVDPVSVDGLAEFEPRGKIDPIRQ